MDRFAEVEVVRVDVGAEHLVIVIAIVVTLASSISVVIVMVLIVVAYSMIGIMLFLRYSLFYICVSVCRETVITVKRSRRKS